MDDFLLVCADFRPGGGMDRANYELASYLAEMAGAKVHLVGYSVAEPLASHPNVTWHKVLKPFNSDTLGEPFLARTGQRVARLLSGRGARVLVNGGNCPWPDVNWVHAVHASWQNRCENAPLSFRLRAAFAKRRARTLEGRALRMASLILANSEFTRRQVAENMDIPSELVRMVYLGVDPREFHPATPEERRAARSRLDLSEARPIIAFIGALGHDRRKGFDVLFGAWERLCRDPAWDADLAVAGHGAELDFWRNQAAARGLSRRFRFLGFTRDIASLLAASDALVSPTFFEPYGMGVHEALCCGLAAFVTRSAGVAERYPSQLGFLLLDDPPTVGDLVRRLRSWRADMGGYKTRVENFAASLRRWTWKDMCREIVGFVEDRSQGSRSLGAKTAY